MYCTKCGVQMDDAARFCSGCGTASRTQQQTYSDNYRPLVRLRSGRWIAGVCSGLARYWGLDPVLVRILFVALALCPVLPAIIPYIVCWIIMPQEPEPQLAGFRPPQQPMTVNQ